MEVLPADNCNLFNLYSPSPLSEFQSWTGFWFSLNDKRMEELPVITAENSIYVQYTYMYMYFHSMDQVFIKVI